MSAAFRNETTHNGAGLITTLKVYHLQHGLNLLDANLGEMFHFHGLTMTPKALLLKQTFTIVNTLNSSYVDDRLKVTLSIGRTSLHVKTKRKLLRQKLLGWWPPFR